LIHELRRAGPDVRLVERQPVELRRLYRKRRRLALLEARSLIWTRSPDIDPGIMFGLGTRVPARSSSSALQ
jgi:hypothetical protein